MIHLTALRIVFLGFPFVLHVILARILDPAALGYFFLFLSVSAFLSACIGMGVPLWAGSQAAVGYLKKNLDFFGIITPALKQIAFFSAVFALVWLVFALSGQGGNGFLSKYGFFVIAMATLLTMNALFCEMLRGLAKANKALILESSSSALLATVLLIMFFSGNAVGQVDLNFVIGSLLFLTGICCCISFWLIKLSSNYSIEVFENLPISSSVWKKTWAIGLGNIIRNVGMHADLWVVGMLLDPGEVAIYGLATRIGHVAVLVQPALRAVMLERIPALIAKKEYSRLAELMYKISRSNFSFTAIVTLVFFLVGGWVIEVLYGVFYTKLWEVCLLLLLGKCIGAFLGPSGLLLNLSGNSRAALVFDIIWLILYLPLLWFFVSSMGLYGAALASAIYVSGLALFLAFRVKEQFGFWSFVK